ncbi:hypothetical protein L202_07428 [Cryptococcus amylolentus CBS 6039]|uniref:Uncharacterized protein n=1 Tax=Cryptococcus amylolentus CBS 6039 TaxID=1295533 RepID=A0A1E3HC53_9TREE|nr:hypothetical protein L202_07428 [Cryptococcus amylolentus CBS 6039]ODN73922.1 hypothetical protein L202_07428 [Cryptococcus amylolentus CBS 6039]
MPFSFKTLHDTLPTSSPAASYTPSEDFLDTLFGSDNEPDNTSLPTISAFSVVFNDPSPPPPVPGTGRFVSYNGPHFVLLAVETRQDCGCQYVFYDPLCAGRQYYFKQWTQPQMPREDVVIQNMWSECLHSNLSRPATRQMLSLWLQGRF